MQLTMSLALTQRIASKRAALDQYRPFSRDVLAYLHRDLRVMLTHHSTAIEGNTLTLAETRLVLEEGLTVGGHTLREHLEATGHAAAFDYLEQLAISQQPLDLPAVLTLHRLAMHDLLEQPGTLRTVAVRIRGVEWLPPPPDEVPDLLAEWLAWLPTGALTLPPVERAAVAHSLFEQIHPFVDGNGRVGRLLLNLVLLREGYPPALLLRQQRAEYLAGLAAAQLRRDYTMLIDVVGKSVERGLDLYLDVVAREREPRLPLAQVAARFGYKVNYLGALARSGRLPAEKVAGRWFVREGDLRVYQQEVAAEQRGRPRQLATKDRGEHNRVITAA